MLELLFECIFDEVYTYVKQNLARKMEVLECNVIKQVCAVPQSMFVIFLAGVSSCSFLYPCETEESICWISKAESRNLGSTYLVRI